MRKAGILAPVFSLPGRFGVGNLGQVSYEFVDRIRAAGASIWQLLPLNPVGYGHSPYQPYSSWAGETLYIDPDGLYEDGFLRSRPESFRAGESYVDYEAVRAYLEPIFREAYGALPTAAPEIRAGFEAFTEAESWVKPYGVFMALKEKNGGKSWPEWPEEEKDAASVMETLSGGLLNEARYHWFLQYLFYRQWDRLRAHAREQGISLMGDIPFYSGLDSQDVWENRDEFLLDPTGYPTHVAGVPPDYFSATGQRWGNPVYDWERMEENGFAFWEKRLKGAAKLCDILRIDHFRAFDTYWKIPATCPTAVEGEWLEAPGYALFDALLPKLDVKIVAEDLGLFRQEVYDLRDHYAFPGMNVMQFTLLDRGFSLRENMITYTGTHDNETMLGWYKNQSARDRRALRHKIRVSERADDGALSRGFIRYAMRSACGYSIVPVWDVLALGNEARVNCPGIVSDKNWSWKMADFSALRAGLERTGYLFSEREAKDSE